MDPERCRPIPPEMILRSRKILSLYDRLGALRPNWLELLFYRNLLDRYHIRPRGVIHLGAHLGEELLPYITLGFSKILLIEPQRGVFERLKKLADLANGLLLQIDAFHGAPAAPRIQVLECAVGKRNGTALLYELSETRTSSLLAPDLEALAERSGSSQEIKLTGRVEVRLRRLDTLLEELPHGWRADDFNFLWMNFQGSEWAALEGARGVLEKLDAVYLTADFERRDPDMPTPAQLDRFLGDFGFSPKQALMHVGEVLGTIFYVKDTQESH